MNAPIDAALPPHSIEAEQSLIGGLLLDGRAWDRIADIITERDFFRDDHRRIFRAIARLLEAGQPADVVTVFDAIERSNQVEQTGGLAYLGEIANATPSAANIAHYARIVRDKAMLRQVQGAAMELHAACFRATGSEIEQLITNAEAALEEAADRSDSEPKALVDVFNEAISYADDRCQRGSGLAGLATGFHDLDRLTGGLEPGQLVVVAARPSCGKTMFAGNIADHVTRNGHAVLFFTLEMGSREIGMRLLSARAKVSVHVMRTGINDDRHWDRMVEQLALADRQRLFICDKGAIGVGFVRAKARQVKRKHGLDLVIIDYLQLMTAPGHTNRTQEIGSISRGLKALAKELQVPIIALAQLNRGVESRPDKRPLMSDLRDSGEVEQDADLIAMLHRENLYSDAPEWQNVSELLVRKNRNGPLGDITLHYLPEEMTFGSYAGPNIRQQLAAAGRASSRDAARHGNRARGIADD